MPRILSFGCSLRSFSWFSSRIGFAMWFRRNVAHFTPTPRREEREKRCGHGHKPVSMAPRGLRCIAATSILRYDENDKFYHARACISQDVASRRIVPPAGTMKRLLSRIRVYTRVCKYWLVIMTDGKLTKLTFRSRCANTLVKTPSNAFLVRQHERCRIESFPSKFEITRLRVSPFDNRLIFNRDICVY